MNNPLLTAPEAAYLLGVRTTTIYAWASERKLPYVKIGGALRFKLRDIEKLIKEGYHPALR